MKVSQQLCEKLLRGKFLELLMIFRTPGLQQLKAKCKFWPILSPFHKAKYTKLNLKVLKLVNKQAKPRLGTTAVDTLN